MRHLVSSFFLMIVAVKIVCARHIWPHIALVSSTEPLYASVVTESADIMRETINKLNADIHFLECRIQSIFFTMYSILGKSFPGPMLSTLLCRPTAAITIEDVLTELTSIPGNAALQ